MFVMVLWRQACALHNVMAWNSSLMWIMHPIIGQPINRSLFVYMLDVLGFWEGNLCSQSCKVSTNGRNLNPMQWNSMLHPQKAVCLLAMAPNRCLVKIERSHCCFLPFHFCFYRLSTLQ